MQKLEEEKKDMSRIFVCEVYMKMRIFYLHTHKHAVYLYKDAHLQHKMGIFIHINMLFYTKKSAFGPSNIEGVSLPCNWL